MSREQFLARYKTGKARMTAEQNGVCIYRGPTFRQLRRLHNHGKCQWDCGVCYHEATKTLQMKGPK